MSSRRDIHAAIGYSHDMMDRLMNPDLTPKQLEVEIGRAKAVTSIIAQAIDGERVINERIKITSLYDPDVIQIPIHSNRKSMGYHNET